MVFEEGGGIGFPYRRKGVVMTNRMERYEEWPTEDLVKNLVGSPSCSGSSCAWKALSARVQSGDAPVEVLGRVLSSCPISWVKKEAFQIFSSKPKSPEPRVAVA